VSLAQQIGGVVGGRWFTGSMPGRGVEREVKAGLPVIRFATVAVLEKWLTAHGSDPGVWVKLAKNGSANHSISRTEALDTMICFGWIDSQGATYDEGWWLQRFTPRRPAGKWSQINCAKVDALVAAGRMRPEGQAEVDAAKADGRWDAAYAGQRTATVPEDLQAALDQSPSAAAFFATLSSVNRYAIIYRIGSVKRAETRARKIGQYVAMLEAGETIYPK
jgi:uncharacterized protein YdeI (YjbR/CyaY-like superfamily)